MKEKIFLSLKTAVKNTAKTASPITLSDKSLQAYAETMAQYVTDEATIDDEVQKMMPTLAVLQGDVNHQISTAVKKTAKQEPTEPNPVIPTSTAQAEEGDLAKTVQDTLAKMLQPIQEKLAEFESKKTREAKVSDAIKLLDSYNLKAEIRDEALSRVTIADDMDAKKVAEATVGEYNRLAKLFSLSDVAIPEAQSKGGNNTGFSAYKKELEKEGRLETAKS